MVKIEDVSEGAAMSSGIKVRSVSVEGRGLEDGCGLWVGDMVVEGGRVGLMVGGCL